MQLHTDRLLLRPLVEDDWNALAAYVTDDDAMHYDHPWPHAEDELRRAVASLAAMDGFWAICDRLSGALIGHIVCRPSGPPDFLTWDIGFGLNPRFQHLGYATEACRSLVEYAFTALGARRIVASCHPDNTAAWKLLERLGFRREAHHRSSGFLRRDREGNPMWTDSYEYALLESEWSPGEPREISDLLPPAQPLPRQQLHLAGEG